jgi:Rps23 Pro-64 3,4-dihydroxylase Tpa1-like proline 4-hydroxylase
MFKLGQVISDASLWGGGMHTMRRDGHLDLHEDSDQHPKTHWHRRLNAILFLNKDWNESWNGHLELWNSSITKCVKKIAPTFNRLVMFTTDDGHFHGVPEKLACPYSEQRMSLATFWFSEPSINDHLKRPRARFVSRPTDPPDPAKEALQKERVHF